MRPATTQDTDYVFDTANPLYAALAEQLAEIVIAG